MFEYRKATMNDIKEMDQFLQNISLVDQDILCGISDIKQFNDSLIKDFEDNEIHIILAYNQHKLEAIARVTTGDNKQSKIQLAMFKTFCQEYGYLFIKDLIDRCIRPSNSQSVSLKILDSHHKMLEYAEQLGFIKEQWIHQYIELNGQFYDSILMIKYL